MGCQHIPAASRIESLMSIKHKLTLMMMSISLAAVILTVIAITVYLIYDMHKSKVWELGVTAALTADRNSAALTFLDSERARQNLEIFRLNPSVMAACIYNANGLLFAGYRSDDPKNVTCPPLAENLPFALPGILTAIREIQQNGEPIGSVFLASNTRDINAYVQKIVQISFTAALLVLMVTLLLAVYFQRTVSKPILELAVTAQSITQKRDYTLKAKATYPDETGILAHAFNDMLGEIHKRDEELRQANETLEQKVTERTRELDDAKRKAEAASEAKSEFLRNMSHEFRTPLHAITSFSAYGIKEHEIAPRAQLKQYFEFVEKASQRLSRMVGVVLDLAGIEQGEQKLLLSRGDLCELVSRSVDMVQPLLREKSLTLQFDHEGAPMPAMCDHDKIAQVLTNLLSNAIKFTPEGKRITLSVHASGSDSNRQAVISIIDEGVGIPEEEKEMIFESFRQSSRTKTGAGGTGLGLAICRGIVKAHGGDIRAENNANGMGARVTFRLPLARTNDSTISKEAWHEHAA